MTIQHKNKTAWNDVTGDSIRTGKGSQDKFASGWDAIWGKKDEPCEACHGEGVIYDAGHTYDCGLCKKEGYK